MQFLAFLYPALLAALALTDPASALRKPSNSVLLSNVKTLTLRKDAKTSHRRVSAIPQLKCVGGNGRGKYEVDVLRCKNAGADYDDENIQWTCSASLPEEFKLGSTDVICEGYDSPDDPYILKGSCGVEYRLVLTEKGEAKYGSGKIFDGLEPRGDWPKYLFLALFAAVGGWILYSAWLAYRNGPAQGGAPRRPGGGFGGWGGNGGPGDDNDPPPPYDAGWGKGGSSRGRGAAGGQEGWRPGFWTGTLGGAAAGYLAGQRGGRQQQMPPRQGGSNWFGNNDGDSNSGWGRSSSGSSSGSGPSARHESTGFGSTSRR